MTLNRFNRIVYPLAYGMPGPKWGGTWLYCGWVHQLANGETEPCTDRFRNEKKYRSHCRRVHA